MITNMASPGALMWLRPRKWSWVTHFASHIAPAWCPHVAAAPQVAASCGGDPASGRGSRTSPRILLFPSKHFRPKSILDLSMFGQNRFWIQAFSARITFGFKLWWPIWWTKRLVPRPAVDHAAVSQILICQLVMSRFPMRRLSGIVSIVGPLSCCELSSPATPCK